MVRHMPPLPVRAWQHTLLKSGLIATAMVLVIIVITIATLEGLSTKSVSNEFSLEPTWSQEFSAMPNGTVDSKTWHYQLDPAVPSYNNEAQAYTSNPSNVRIEDGELLLQAHRQAYQYSTDPSKKEYQLTSARIDTSNSFTFEYGKVDVTMKLPKGTGTWPAFWFLSANQPYTTKLKPTAADWSQPRFYMHDGEIDAMEAYGNKPGYIEGTLHSFDKSTIVNTRIADASDAFHTYGIQITPDSIIWTIDSKVYGKIDRPSNEPDQWPVGNNNRFYLILNLAMGGTAGNVDEATNQWTLAIKSVKFYSYKQ